jgi:hypothetical protein
MTALPESYLVARDIGKVEKWSIHSFGELRASEGEVSSNVRKSSSPLNFLAASKSAFPNVRSRKDGGIEDRGKIEMTTKRAVWGARRLFGAPTRSLELGFGPVFSMVFEVPNKENKKMDGKGNWAGNWGRGMASVRRG